MIELINSTSISDKNVILRLDLDVPIQNGEIIDDFRLQAAIPTIQMCLINAKSTTIIGHIGRPNGKIVEELSVKPVFNYFESIFGTNSFESGSLKILENLRFEPGEELCDLNFAKEIAQFGNYYVNEAFAAHHPAASTTVLPTILPHAIGLRFAKEIEILSGIKNRPMKPQVALIGGAKIEDKYQAVVELSKYCDFVLVGGLLPNQIKQQNLAVSQNVILAEESSDGLDISSATIDQFKQIIKNSNRVIWAGPMGKYEDPNGNNGDKILAETIIEFGKESIIGGGDTQAALVNYLTNFSFVSVGGGAMLKFLSEGTLPTIEVLM